MNSRILRAFIWFSENSYFNEKFWKSYKRWIRKNPTDFRAFPRKWQLRLEMKFLKILRIQPSLSRWKITFQFILGLKSTESNLPTFFSRRDIQYIINSRWKSPNEWGYGLSLQLTAEGGTSYTSCVYGIKYFIYLLENKVDVGLSSEYYFGLKRRKD